MKKDIYFGFPPRGFIASVALDYGHYETVGEFIEKSNKTMKEKSVLKGGVQFKESELTKKVTMEIKSGYSMLLNGRVSRILGFGGVTERQKNSGKSLHIGLECFIYNLRVLRHCRAANCW